MNLVHDVKHINYIIINVVACKLELIRVPADTKTKHYNSDPSIINIYQLGLCLLAGAIS